MQQPFDVKFFGKNTKKTATTDCLYYLMTYGGIGESITR